MSHNGFELETGREHSMEPEQVQRKDCWPINQF